jgi:phage head maturation protease
MSKHSKPLSVGETLTSRFQGLDPKFVERYQFKEMVCEAVLVGAEVKDIENLDGTTSPIGEVTALVNIYGIVDDGDDVMELGVFTKSITEQFRRIRCLDQHNTNSVIYVVGKPVSVQEIGKGELPPELLQRRPEATGALKTVTRYMLDDPTSLAVYQRVSRDYINEYSIGFFIIKFNYDRITDEVGKNRTVRRITEGSLLEYSNVIWGMNPETMTTDVKEREMNPPAEIKEYGPDGPERKLGEYVKASVYDCWTYCINQLMSEGMISDTEHLALAEGGLEMLRMMGGLMGNDIALRPYEYMPMFFMWGNEFIDRQIKEGRVLSQSNVDKVNATIADIEGAAGKLREILQAAGISDTMEDSEEDKANPQPAEPGQGAPAQPLTEQERADLLKQIQITELEFLEAHDGRTNRGHPLNSGEGGRIAEGSESHPQ